MTRRVLAVACALCASGPGVLDAQLPSFSSRVDSVRVDVLVTRDGQPVTGLRAGDFELRDNGVRQTVDVVSYDEVPLNVVMVLDASASVDAERLQHLQNAGRTLLARLNATDRAALVTFNHLVLQRAALGSPLEELNAALNAVVPSGQTNLIDATFAGLLLGGSAIGRSLMIVFSDGIDSTSWLAADEVLGAARRADVVVYAAELGTGRRSGFLRDLANATGGRALNIESARDLTRTFHQILGEFRHRYLISFSPAGAVSDGWHQLDVRVGRRGATVRARPGYFAGR